ncbi:MAG: radical SAM protein [bacterium]
MKIETIEPLSILTRTGGYLESVCSHSLQPFTGCALGASLCGVGCYAQHQQYKTAGRTWGEFLDIKQNTRELYLNSYRREQAWARKNRGQMSIFFSSSTEPFPPQDRRLGVTAGLLEAMLQSPPDELIVQTHSHLVAEYIDLLAKLHEKMQLRIHISIETDRERIPGLPGHFSSVQKRMEAAKNLKQCGIKTVITVAPLLPIDQPELFFRQLSEVADAVVIDHFIDGDGSRNGSRTWRTALPEAIRQVNAAALDQNYREQIAAVAATYFPGRVGIGKEGFAGRYDFGKIV